MENEIVDETTRAVKDRGISFRVSEEEYQWIEKQARDDGETASGWCRKLIVTEARKAIGMTAIERILIEEMGVLRFLLGRALKKDLPAEEYEKLRQEVDQNYTRMGNALVEKRTAKRSSSSA
jgi:hypothetical protein